MGVGHEYAGAKRPLLVVIAVQEGLGGRSDQGRRNMSEGRDFPPRYTFFLI